MAHFGEFLKPEVCGQTVLLDRLLFLGHKLVENATFWEDKSSLKMPKMVNFGEFFKNQKLAVKKCYQTDLFQ